MSPPLSRSWLLFRFLWATIPAIFYPMTHQLWNPVFRSMVAGLILVLLAAIFLIETLLSYVFGLLRFTLVVLLVSLAVAIVLDWLLSDVQEPEKQVDETG